MIFGNLNPSRQQNFQAKEIAKIVKFAETFNLMKDVIYINHDEIIFCIDEDKSRFDYLANCLNPSFTDQIKLKFKLFKLNQIESDIFIKFVEKEQFDGIEKEIKTEELVGVAGNQFYLYFKKHILKEAIKERDLYFINDNKLAKWVI